MGYVSGRTKGQDIQGGETKGWKGPGSLRTLLHCILGVYPPICINAEKPEKVMTLGMRERQASMRTSASESSETFLYLSLRPTA